MVLAFSYVVQAQLIVCFANVMVTAVRPCLRFELQTTEVGSSEENGQNQRTQCSGPA